MLPHPKRKRSLSWWAVSIGVHLALAITIAWYSPLRSWLFNPAPTDQKMPSVSRSRMNQITSALREKYQRALKKSADELAVTHREMIRLQAKRLGQVNQQEPQLIDTQFPELKAVAFDTKDQSIADLYAHCVTLEQAVIEAYERVRGYDMASRQYLPISQAVKVNRIARPERPRIRGDVIEAEIESTQDPSFAAFKQEMLNADLEAKEIGAFTERLLLMAKGIMGEDNQMGVLQWEVGNLEGNIRGTRFDEGKPYVGAVLLPHEMQNRGTGGTFTGNPVFARKVSDQGDQADWMSIDSWWMIGPFSHPGRQNLEDLDKKYPPEETVDLGASYQGKGGKSIRWKYRQTRFVRIEPPPEDTDRYAIWYAYTEIYSDKEQDLWCAFGSDDYGKAWVEGKLVWASGKGVKPWAPGQDYRKVHLKQGHNRMLVKLENAGGTTGFSVIFALDPNL
jgi:hypothetical protein